MGAAREETWTRKSYTILECRHIFSEVEDAHLIPNQTNTYIVQAATRIATAVVSNYRYYHTWVPGANAKM